MGHELPSMADEVPADLARLWRLSTSARRGRPAELDVDRVVGAAVDLADHEGLDGVTLQKVAQTLGFTKMALYRHVGSKEELLELMADHAYGPAPRLDADVWRDGVHLWAAAIRARYAEHPWLVEVPVAGPPRGPNAIDWMDAFLRALHDTGLDPRTKAGVLVVVSGYVRNAILQGRQMAEGRSGTGLSQVDVERDYGRALAALVHPERFPEAAPMFAVGAFESEAGEDPEDHDFVFGLDLILDGVEVAIARRTR